MVRPLVILRLTTLKKATKSGIEFRNMISDKVFKKADFTEVMRQFSIDTGVAQRTLDDFKTTFKDLNAEGGLTNEILNDISGLQMDKAFADEMVRVANIGGKTISSLNGVAGEAMDVETYLKKATEQGLTFEQMARDTTLQLAISKRH